MNMIGANAASTTIGDFLNAQLHEILVYNFALSTSQRQQVEGYLAWKWNLISALPSNHPFKLWPPLP
jgi:hypothetical protein